MANQIKVGDEVNGIVYAWSEDKLPTVDHFFSGKVKGIIRKSKNIVYIQIEGLKKILPEDKVRLA